MAPYWTRKAENSRIVGEAVRMMWLRADPGAVAAFIESQATR